MKNFLIFNHKYNNYRLQKGVNFQEKETDVIESTLLVTCCLSILKIEMSFELFTYYFVLCAILFKYAIFYDELKIENILFLKYTYFRL